MNPLNIGSAVVAAFVTGRGSHSQLRTALAVRKPLRIRSPARSTPSHRTGLGHAVGLDPVPSICIPPRAAGGYD